MFHNRRPLALLLIMVLSTSLVAQQSTVLFNAYASESSPYDSGLDHGCDDAGRSEQAVGILSVSEVPLYLIEYQQACDIE